MELSRDLLCIFIVLQLSMPLLAMKRGNDDGWIDENFDMMDDSWIDKNFEEVRFLAKEKQEKLNQQLIQAIDQNKPISELATLLEEGAQIDGIKKNGAVARAVFRNRTEVLELFLKHGFDVNGYFSVFYENSDDKLTVTPLIYAINTRSFEVIKWLIKNNVDLYKQADKGYGPIISACAAEYLPDACVNIGCEPKDYSIAHQKKDLEILEYLLIHGADPDNAIVTGDEKTFSSYTPLCYLAATESDREEDSEYDCGTRKHYISCAKLLLAYRANSDLKSDSDPDRIQAGDPLFQAIYYSFGTMVKLLLESGASVKGEHVIVAHETAALNGEIRKLISYDKQAQIVETDCCMKNLGEIFLPEEIMVLILKNLWASRFNRNEAVH